MLEGGGASVPPTIPLNLPLEVCLTSYLANSYTMHTNIKCGVHLMVFNENFFTNDGRDENLLR